MTKIAFLGVGVMGTGMARNLLKAGYSVTVYNRTEAKTQALINADASRGASPAEAVADADVIIAIVGDDHSSRKIWLGESGVLAGNPKPNAIAIESTTLSLAWVRELDQHLTGSGLRFIDSPVTGGRNGAESCARLNERGRSQPSCESLCGKYGSWRSRPGQFFCPLAAQKMQLMR